MTFGEPRWLILLLLIPVMVTVAVIMARVKSTRWQAFVADRLRQRLLRRQSPIPRWISFFCLLMSIGLLIVALARPQDSKGTEEQTIMGRNIMIALDLSRSMEVEDVSPNRLGQAKTTCYELLESLPNDRIGLIGFAGSSYLFAPLTIDHAAIQETIQQVDRTWMPTGGSRLESGLDLAIKTLDKSGTQQNALIIMTDGDETTGDITDMATQAQEAGIEVITIGFGTTEGGFVPDKSMPDGRFRDRQGQEVISRLQARPLEKLAAITGGRFAIAASGADIPAMVESAIADLERVQMQGREQRVVIEYYQWFLLPSILLLIASVVAATRWRNIGASPATAAALITFFVFTPDSAQALSYNNATRALEEGRNAEAAAEFGALAEKFKDQEKGFRYRLAEGTAAYRDGDMATARSAFSEALRSKDPEVVRAAHHGIGNTLFQIGWQRLSAGRLYPKVLPDPEEGTEEDSANPFGRLLDALLEIPEQDEVDEIDMGDFEKMIKQRLAEWMAESPDDPGDPESSDSYQSRGSERFNDLLTDWIDAVKHYDGAKGYEDSSHNRDVTVKHLKKLQEILSDIEEGAQAIQAVPMEGPGEPGDGPPQPGDGEGEPQDEGNGGESDPNAPDGEGNDGEPNNSDGPGDENDGKPQESDKEAEDKQPKPGESPEDAARRILKENADLQKGAISSGRLNYRQPEKDW